MRKKAPLKALLLLLIFAFGSFTVSGTVLPFTISDARKNSGSFLLTASPSSIVESQGTNATATVTILSTQGFSGSVYLTAQLASGSIAVAFNPSKVRVSNGGNVTSTAIVQAFKNASTGTYSIIVTGSAAVGRKVLSSSALLTATVSSEADFGLYAYPHSISVIAGFTNSTNVVLDSKNGFNGLVTLSATVPFGFIGVMGGQNPAALTPGGRTNTSLLVSTTTSTSVGKYNITITGTSGNVSHSCTLTVSVVSPTPESLTLSGSSTNSPTNLTLSLRNNGNTMITLQSYSVTDSSGDVWTLANWTGPTITPGSVSPAVILIGSSCNACSYNGITGLFLQFFPGHTYTITVITRLNNQFMFIVTA